MDYKSQICKIEKSLCFTFKVNLSLFYSFVYSSSKYCLNITFWGDQRRLDLKGEDRKERTVRSKRKDLYRNRKKKQKKPKNTSHISVSERSQVEKYSCLTIKPNNIFFRCERWIKRKPYHGGCCQAGVYLGLVLWLHHIPILCIEETSCLMVTR